MSHPLPRDAADVRSFAATLLGVSALALGLRTLALGSQPLLSDDLMVGATARNFVGLGWPGPTMWNHPRLRDLLVSLSLHAFGEGPWGLKVWSVLLGTLAVPVTAILVLRLTSSRKAAVIAALVVALDGLHVDFSRQAINDAYLSFLPVAAIVALLQYRDRPSRRWLVGAGLLLGLGVAGKWSAAFPVAFAAAAVLWTRLRDAEPGAGRRGEVAAFGASLVLLPVAVYVLTWWPWFGRGHDLGEFVRFHALAARESATHIGYPGTKLPGFPGEVVGAWRWFLQPIWYVDYLPPMEGRADAMAGSGFFLSGVANPLTWLATLPAVVWAGARWWKARDEAAGWLLLLFLGAYLPFAAVPRPIWTNSAVAVVPFFAALVAWAAARLHDRRPLPVRVWGVAAVALALLLWPPAAGISVRASDAVLRALVSPAAMDPATHINQ